MQDSLRRKDSAAATAIGVVTLILALGAAILILVAPAATELLLSFKKFNVARGILSSPWVGLGNFEMLLQNPHFAQSLLWTLLHPLFSALFVFLMSLVTGYVLLAVGKARWLRHTLCTLLLIPLIVPSEIWVRLFAGMRLYALEREAGILSGLVIALWCSIKYLGLAALLVTAAMSHGRRKLAVPLLAAGASALAVLGLMGRFDAGFIRLMPPMLYPVTGLDPLAYRSGLVGMQLGVGASANVIMLVLKVVAQAIVALPILLLVKGLFPAGCKPDDSTLRSRLASLAVPGIVLIATAVVLAINAFRGGSGGLMRAFASYPVYIVLAFMSAAFNVALCFLLARPAACSGKTGRIVMTAALALLTALGLTAVPLGEYLLFRSVGLINNWFAVLFSGIGAVWGVWPLLFAARGLGVNTSTEWFTRMWKPALGLWAIQAMLQMNNTLPALLYMARQDGTHPLLLAWQQTAQGGPINLMLLTVAVLIVPLVILLITRTILNEKESLGLFLPGK